MPKVPRAHSNALLEPNSRYEGRDAEWSYFVTTTRCHLKEISHKTEDRRNLSPNTSHVVPLDHKGKGHHDQDHKDKGWYDPVKAPFQECQVVDSCARKFIDQERCNQKILRRWRKYLPQWSLQERPFGRNGKSNTNKSPVTRTSENHLMRILINPLLECSFVYDVGFCG